MKKTFAANWISAARAMTPAPSSTRALHTLRPGIALAAERQNAVVEAERA